MAEIKLVWAALTVKRRQAPVFFGFPTQTQLSRSQGLPPPHFASPCSGGDSGNMSKDDMDNPRLFFDITIAGEEAGRIVMTLFADVVPKTVENFRCAAGWGRRVRQMGCWQGRAASTGPQPAPRGARSDSEACSTRP